jgi:hypothetical protein
MALIVAQPSERSMDHFAGLAPSFQRLRKPKLRAQQAHHVGSVPYVTVLLQLPSYLPLVKDVGVCS